MSGESWTIEHRGRPLLVNAERSSHWSVRSETTREWREAFGWLAREQRIPPLVWCSIRVDHLTATRRSVDVAACLPAAKAGIDSLVDVGVLADDGPLYVLAVTFTAPRCEGYDAVRLTISGTRAEER